MYEKITFSKTYYPIHFLKHWLSYYYSHCKKFYIQSTNNIAQTNNRSNTKLASLKLPP